MLAYGVDIGGTTVKCGRFDDKGELLKKWEIPTRTENDGEYIIPDIAKAITEDMKEAGVNAFDVKGIGVGIPGPILPDGKVNGCVNLGWGVKDVAKELSSLVFGLPVRTGNDANVAALGENWKGGGQGADSMIMVTLGTGVGGGIVLNGKILSGATGAGGEIGHIHVNDEEENTCGCGNKGCLEQYASATGIARYATENVKDYPDSSLNQVQDITAKDVFDAAKEGDAFAKHVVDWMGKQLGTAMSYLAVSIDPSVFVIGGGVSAAGDILLDAIGKYYKEYAFHSNINTPIKLATLGNDAGIYGAVAMIVGE